MTHNENEKDHARNGHYRFLYDRGVEQAHTFACTGSRWTHGDLIQSYNSSFIDAGFACFASLPLREIHQSAAQLA